jgi:branched-chain amino acid transport system permease protein
VSYIPLRFTAIAEYKYLIFGIALVLIMIFRSQGLFPARQRLLAYGRTAYQRIAKKDGASPWSNGKPPTGLRPDPDREKGIQA